MTDDRTRELADAHEPQPDAVCSFHKPWKEHSTVCIESGMAPASWCDNCLGYWTAAELRRLVSERDAIRGCVAAHYTNYLKVHEVKRILGLLDESGPSTIKVDASPTGEGDDDA